MSFQTDTTYTCPSPQIGTMGVIDLTDDFSIERKYFLVKNDGSDDVTLEVKLANTDEWIETTFYVGWNVELVKAIKAKTNTSYNLKYGY